MTCVCATATAVLNRCQLLVKIVSNHVSNTHTLADALRNDNVDAEQC
jgi:hypothetical protein